MAHNTARHGVASAVVRGVIGAAPAPPAFMPSGIIGPAAPPGLLNQGAFGLNRWVVLCRGLCRGKNRRGGEANDHCGNQKACHALCPSFGRQALNGPLRLHRQIVTICRPDLPHVLMDIDRKA